MNIPNLQTNVILAPYTTFKIGGPAKYFVVVKTKDELAHAFKEAHAAGENVFVLGGGSNILISDKGFDGLVIKSEIRDIEFDEEKKQVRAGSGVRLSTLVTQSALRGLQGLEYSIGVPASVGGAVWANLGARGSELKDFLIEVTIIDEEGKLRTLTPAECAFGYRESIFKHKQYVIVDALFQLQPGDKKEIQARVQELSKLRKDTQDVAARCAGCAFRNPKDQTDVAAGKLIDDLGLKGFSIGGAQVSPIHGNFIINTGNATAEDIITLISYIKQQVRDKKGIQLMEEVEYVGF